MSATVIVDTAALAAGRRPRALALEHARRFLDAAELAWLAELDRRGTTDAKFGLRTPRWLAHEAKLPHAVATSRVRTAAKATGVLAPVGDALRDASIGFDHARVLTDELFRLHTRDTDHTADTVPGRPQLLAEAFVELCRRGLAIDIGASTPPRTEATVVIDAIEPDRHRRLRHPTHQHRPLGLRPDPPADRHHVQRPSSRARSCPAPRQRSPGQGGPLARRRLHLPRLRVATQVERHPSRRRMGPRRHHRHRPPLRPLSTPPPRRAPPRLDPRAHTHDGWTRPEGHTFWGQRHQRQRAGPAPDT